MEMEIIFLKKAFCKEYPTISQFFVYALIKGIDWISFVNILKLIKSFMQSFDLHRLWWYCIK